MNPTHVFLIALLGLVAWNLGYHTGKSDDDEKFWPDIVSVVFAIVLLVTVAGSLVCIIYRTL